MNTYGLALYTAAATCATSIANTTVRVPKGTNGRHLAICAQLAQRPSAALFRLPFV